MRHSLILMLVLAVATLAPRIVTGDEPPVPDQDGFQHDLALQLESAGFATEELRLGTLRSVEARRGDCSLAAAAEIFHGAKADAFVAVQPEGRELHVHYHGWGRDYPRVRPLVSQYVRRYLATAGLADGFAPVVLVAADPACDLTELPISELRMQFRK